MKSLLPLRDRGRADLERQERERAENVAYNVAEGQRQIRRSFVFRFYHDTLDTNLSGAYHKLGPDSPDPDIRPEAEPGPLGGQYHDVDWLFGWEGIRWKGVYTYRDGSWNLNFYVRRQRRWFRSPEWRIVHSPAQVVEALT